MPGDIDARPADHDALIHLDPAKGGTVLEFELLGDVRARSEAGPVDLGPMRARCVLVALLVDANHPVTADALIKRVWGDRPPATARGTLSTYLTHVRRTVADPDVRVERRRDGYALVIAPSQVDLHRFTDLATRARAAADDRLADIHFTEALGLWRGDALTGLDTRWAEEVRTALARQRLAAELDHADVRLRLGAHSDLVPPLTARAAEHPLDERLAGQLVLALYRAGRPGQALAHYRRVAADLGRPPGPALRALHHALLSADSTVQPPRALIMSAAVPRGLPSGPTAFTGPELDMLTARLHGPFGVVAISGEANTGKTALALRWAHDHASEFPGGQLHATLRNADPTAVLRDFLTALGVPPTDLPTDPGDLAPLYRSVIADREVLVVLDDAVDTRQVVPLLPGGPTCATLVTSRRPLIALAASHGALSLRLTPSPSRPWFSP
ncbi:MAG: BTAD domain-containing putative transcriptional regulator [Umezawaea sp.]